MKRRLARLLRRPSKPYTFHIYIDGRDAVYRVLQREREAARARGTLRLFDQP